jgi:hypothetical protein
MFGRGAIKERPTTKGNQDEEPCLLRRLEELKDLFDRGLITTEEYERKRAEILKEL